MQILGKTYILKIACHTLDCMYPSEVGNWNLQLASLKQMAVFTAYDRTTYQKLIPRHLAELLQAPPEVLSCLQLIR